MNRRQMIFGGLVPALGAMGLMAPSALAKKAKKKKKGKQKYKIITRSFHNPAFLTLPDVGTASPYPAPIAVSGFKQGKIRDVNVTLHGFNHEQPADLDVLLVAPDGTSALLMSDVGGSTNVYGLTISIDDQAPAPMPELTPLESASYKPTIYNGIDFLPPPAPGFVTGGKLSVFKNRKPNGVWRLYINDDVFNIESGSVSGGWSLRIRARVKK